VLSGRTSRWSLATSFVFGLGFITSAYDLLARVGGTIMFGLLLSALTLGGIVFAIAGIVPGSAPRRHQEVNGEMALAGLATPLVIAPLFWNSGRLNGDEIDFFGPVGQSGFMHLTLVQRLMHHVPPDNFVVAGLSPPFYHYYGDQAFALATCCTCTSIFSTFACARGQPFYTACSAPSHTAWVECRSARSGAES
jgi:hypothetical protein